MMKKLCLLFAVVLVVVFAAGCFGKKCEMCKEAEASYEMDTKETTLDLCYDCYQNFRNTYK